MSDEDNIDPKLEAEYAEGDRLLQKLEEDEALAQDIGSVTDFDELAAKIRAHGFNISDQVIAEIIIEEAEEEGELSEDQLEEIAGGSGGNDVTNARNILGNIATGGNLVDVF